MCILYIIMPMKKDTDKKKDADKKKDTLKKYNFRSRSSKYSDKKHQSSEDTSSSTEEEEEMDQLEFNKFISKIFPSKYINQRVKQILKKEELEHEVYESEEDDSHEDESEEDDSEEDSDQESYAAKRKKNKSTKQRKIDESEEETDDDDEMHGHLYSKKGGYEVFIYPNSSEKEYYDDESEEEDENEESEEEESDKDYKAKSRARKLSKNQEKYSEEDSELLTKFSKMAQELKKQHDKSALLDELIQIGDDKRKELNRGKNKKVKKIKIKNMKQFSQLVKDRKKETDYTMFKKMELVQQDEVLHKLLEIKKYNDDEIPMRVALLQTDIPVNYKAVALRKMNTLEYMEPGTNEYYKLKQWVDTFMRIPFNKYSHLPLTIEDGVEKCHEFMQASKDTLNSAVYGLNDAKMQIIQMVGQWITNPDAVGSAIAIKGPMGTGKTTLVKNGISKILGREFAFIALGGATDSSVLEGHSYTYEGSTWGKIVDILVQCKSMNPVIYFDELDKISNTPKGEEIVSILTHLTDTTQNSQFHDKYFSEIELDLSKCLFIFSYNEEEKVNPILKDRMYRISTKGYTIKEKRVIVDDYLLPSIQEQLKFKSDEVIIDEKVMQYIIEKYTQEEDGVRNLKRCLETIYRKLNLFKLMKEGNNLFEEDLKIDVSFPITMTNDIVDKIVKLSEGTNKAAMSMYM